MVSNRPDQPETAGPSLPSENAFAAELFDGIATRYEGPARVLSLGQYDRWHRALVSHLHVEEDARVLDVATGTGLVAGEIYKTWGSKVVGVDLSPQMLRTQAKRGGPQLPRHGLALLRGRAETLPFVEGAFDAVVFTYLLRYVGDPEATLRELARVLRPRGVLASLEFAIPRGPILYPLWLAHTRLALPLAGRLLGAGWRRTGDFLGWSISDFYRRHPLPTLLADWEAAGLEGVQVQRLSLGGAVVIWGRKGGPT